MFGREYWCVVGMLCGVWLVRGKSGVVLVIIRPRLMQKTGWVKRTVNDRKVTVRARFFRSTWFPIRPVQGGALGKRKRS